MAAQNQSKGRNRPIVQLEKAVQLYLLWYSLTGPVRQFADYKLQLWQAEAGEAEVPMPIENVGKGLRKLRLGKLKWQLRTWGKGRGR